MKVRTARILPIAVLCLTAIGRLFAEETNFIISKWHAAIQLISLESFSTWPGAENPIPVDALVTNSRMVFVLPGAVVSLDESGAADERTLLALYTTTFTERGKDSWTPALGTITPDCLWKSWNPADSTIRETDLSTALVEKTPRIGLMPDSLHALSDGRLLILSGEAAYLMDESGKTAALTEKIPLLSMTAVSPSQPKIAWRTPGSEEVFFADGRGRTWKQSIAGAPFPPSSPWDMAWTDSMIVTAWPGRLIAFAGADANTVSPESVFVLEDERLPGRWYRLFGGTDRLLVFSPESAAVAIVSAPGVFQSDTDIAIPEFIDVVGTWALSAADRIEAEGGIRAAEGFCSWIIPYVRSFRSDHPMNPLWPELEAELTHRRAALRELLD